VFHAVRRVRAHRGLGVVSRWLANVACGALGAVGRGHDGARVRLRWLGVLGVRAGIQISMMRCGVFVYSHINVLAGFAPSEAKRPDRTSKR